jgi:hypothetical protein
MYINDQYYSSCFFIYLFIFGGSGNETFSEFLFLFSAEHKKEYAQDSNYDDSRQSTAICQTTENSIE